MPRVPAVLLIALFTVEAASAAGRPPLPLTRMRPATPEAADVLEECTIGVLSGSVTADGRPLLWKNRDTGFLDNEVAYFADGTYPCVTLINAGDALNAWIGVNEPGFAILNSLSYNIVDSSSVGITNGQLMKLALATCASVSDFERLLEQTAPAGRQNPANLAVIDAQGGAAIFEVGNHHHHRFDADGRGSGTPGYLVRANFSLSEDTTGVETWRFRRASELVGRAVAGGARRASVLEISRDLCAESCDPYPLPFAGFPPGYPAAYGYVDTYETIQRVSTVSAGLIQGVRPGEDPGLSTFFVALGKTAVTPFVPTWVAGGPTPPELDGPSTAPFCDLARARAGDCYDHPGSFRLINTRKLAPPSGAGLPHLRLVRRIESEAHARVDSLLAAWRVAGLPAGDVAVHERAICAAMYRQYAGNEAGGGAPGIAWRVTPNPMRESVGISAILAEPGAEAPVRIDVFDVTGKRVARLTGGAEEGFTWNGRDASGRPLPTGLYFGRSPDVAATARILVVR